MDFIRPAWQGLTIGIKNLFALDLRSLALFRVLISLAVLYNAGVYFFDAPIFLSDQGLYPRDQAFDGRNFLHWSLYGLIPNAAGARALLALTMASALALLLGWRTRLASIVTWVLVVSLTNRTQMLTSGADLQLCVLLFWAMFLPLGARFSVDSALTADSAPDRDAQDTSCFSAASIAILLQVVYLYFFGALIKNSAAWTSDFTAIYYALSSVQFSSPAAPLLLSSQGLMKVVTAYVFWLELLAIVFLLMPRWYQQTRLFILPQLIAMHLGFLIFLSVGWFPLVSIAGLTLFVPALFWNRILPWWNSRAARHGIEIYYDRDCEFCRKTCLIFRKLCLPPEVPIAPAQDNESVRELFEREDSWVVRGHDGRPRTRWEAVAYIWRRSPLLWPLGVLSAVPGLHWLCNALYRQIGNNRQQLGGVTRILLPYRNIDTSGRLHPEATIVVSLLAGLVLWWNVDTLEPPHLPLPDFFKPVLQAAKLPQKWNMFAPYPRRSSKWTVLEGRTVNGESINLLQPGRPILRHRPASGYSAYPHKSWRKYFDRVNLGREGERIGRVFCEMAHRRGMKLEHVRIENYRQTTPEPDQQFELPTTDASHQEPCRVP